MLSPQTKIIECVLFVVLAVLYLLLLQWTFNFVCYILD